MANSNRLYTKASDMAPITESEAEIVQNDSDMSVSQYSYKMAIFEKIGWDTFSTFSHFHFRTHEHFTNCLARSLLKFPYVKKCMHTMCLSLDIHNSIIDTLLMHSAETHGGSSGCPVLREVNNEWAIVAMHCGVIWNRKTKQPGNQALCIKAIKDFVCDEKVHVGE